MQATSQERFNSKTYGSLKLYNSSSSKWVNIRSNEVGDIKYSIKPTDHLGWIVCDGRSLSRDTYSELFSIIGTTYGNVDQASFNIPDCRGRVLGGSGSGTGLTPRNAGTLTGSETHVMTIPEMPTHTHTINDPGHSHTYQNQPNTTSPAVSLTTTDVADNVNVQQTTGTSTTGITLNTTGNSQPFNIMQPTAFVGYVFIFAKHTREEY